MAKIFFRSLFVTVIIFLIINSLFAQRPIFPNSIVLHVAKDVKTLQYVTNIEVGEPLFSTKLVLDLGGQFMWVDNSSEFTLPKSQNPIFCSSLQCCMAKTNACRTKVMEKNICRVEIKNSITKDRNFGDLVEDDVVLRFRDGLSLGASVTIHDFLFLSTDNMLLNGLAIGVKGILGIGNSRIALPSQLSTRFGFQRKFAMCLSSSNGVVLAGDGPYVSLGKNYISRSLVYTPLVGGESLEYFVNVKSIKINGVKLNLNSSKLVLDEEGSGGTMITTILPYATLQSSIYDEFVKVYVDVAKNLDMVRVDVVAPFDLCFKTTLLVGQNVPIVEFGLQSELVKWRVHGRNSLVQVSDDVICLGFLNGGKNQRASIVIGGYQLEENLLEFNLGTSMLGFVSLLNGKQQGSCSDFSLHNPIAV